MGLQDDIAKARNEAMASMRAAAQRGETITYSQLVKGIEAMELSPRSDVLAKILDDISLAEDAAGRGMLSAVVVHAADQLPGEGFNKLGKQLGRDVSDPAVFHATELAGVLAANATR